jgi:hypothetical protein
MDRLNRRCAKNSGSAEVRIEFALLSSERKTIREWETSTHIRNIGVRASTCDRQHINNKMTVWNLKVFPNHIPMSIPRSSRPSMVDLQPQVPHLSSPRFKHELFKHVDDPIVEVNDVPRARAPGDVVHKHSSCEALTQHRRARYPRRRSKPTMNP